MNIHLHTQGFSLTPAINGHVDNRVSSALHPFAENVTRVDVYLKDLNGPKGGDDMVALIRVRLRNRSVIAVETVRSDLYAAVAEAALRLKRAVRRAIRKHYRIDKHEIRRLQHDPTISAGAGLT